jgi:hypothetical protein
MNEHGYTPLTPTREVSLKGPGLIFAGNPKNYLTEIPIFVTGKKSSWRLGLS